MHLSAREENTMRVELGETVRTIDGEEAGVVRYLIVDPGSRNVRAVVLEQGLLFKDDTEIPLEALQEAPEGGLMLTYSADRLHHLPQFDINRYTEPTERFIADSDLPQAGVLWPSMTPFPNTVTGPGVYPILSPPQGAAPNYPDEADVRDEPRLARQEADVVVSEGSDVVTMDGDKVGEVHHIAFDAVSGRPIRLVVKKGFLFTQDVEIPVEEIGSVDRGIVMLKLSKEEFRRWAQGATAPLI
jgi:uncharacterized protein YrrD